MKVHLGGHLNFYEPQRRIDFQVTLAQPTPVAELIRAWGIPPGEVFLTVLNHTLVDWSHAIADDADDLRLYPPVGGGAISPRPARPFA